LGLALGNNTNSKTINAELRNTFSRYLGKLNDNHTVDVGFNEIKKMIDKFNSAEALRIYIGSLSILNKNSTHQAKEVQALIVGYIASKYRDNLIDPLDKPGNVLKTINRMMEILKSFMKENSFTVHKAISISYKELFDHCMPKDNKDDIITIFFTPLEKTILSGIDKMAQIAASIVLSEMIEHIGQHEKYQDLLESTQNKICNVVIKSKCESPQVYDCLFNLLKSNKLESISNKLPEIYEKLITVLNSQAHFLVRIYLIF